jgi:activating signal cointegrator 1
MRGLSLTQPWASLVALGAKKIETRSWSTPYRGLIAIHASKTFPGWAKEYCWQAPFLKHLRQKKAGHGDVRSVINDLPLQKIVAVAQLTDCLPTTTGALLSLHDQQPVKGSEEYAFGDYSAGRYMWLLSNVIALPEPIECKGALSLWEVPLEIENQINQQLMEVTV